MKSSGNIDVGGLWESMHREALERVKNKFPKEDVENDLRMKYFCEEVAYRLRHLFSINAEDPKIQSRIDDVVLLVIEEMLDLPADVATFTSETKSERSFELEYEVLGKADETLIQ